MSAPPPPPSSTGGLSLYGDLVDPNEKPAASSTISSAPVLYNNASTPAADAPKKAVDAALRFQPIRRPPVKSQKNIKVKSLTASAPTNAPTTAAPAATKPSEHPQPAAPSAPPKSTLADWVNNEEDDFYYGTGEKRQRGGRRAKKKKQHQQAQLETNWDDIYDPSRPTNVEEYLKSDEKIDEVRDWKALLYRHRRKKEESDSDSEDGGARPGMSNQFAPPSNYNFAPPPISPPRDVLPPPPPPPPDAAQIQETSTSSATISAAPIRYDTNTNQDDQGDSYSPPPAFSTEAASSEEKPKSSLPGQASFAARLMSKYGWTSGTGLGASASGITTPLSVKVEKRKKRSDAEGGGWAEPANKGKIIGGKYAKREEDEADRKGAISQVVVLRNMLEGLEDLQKEIEAGLGQEIGEECGEKYGRVERLYIDQAQRLVFIKFTNQVSSLRAVNELNGRIFNGHAIAPSFYDVDLFEQGIYDR